MEGVGTDLASSNTAGSSGDSLRTILVIDRNIEHLRRASDLITSLGHYALPVSDPQQASRLLATYSDTIHLLIMELELAVPRVSDVVALGAGPRGVISTVYTTPHPQEALQEHGFAPLPGLVLHKPLTLAALTHAIETALPTDQGTETGADKPSLAGIRALVAEDQGITLKLLTRIIHRAGMLVYSYTADGIEALNRALEGQPEMLLLDVKMPYLRGTEVARRVFDVYTPCIVFITAFPTDVLNDQDERVRQCAIVTKPVYSDTLLLQLEAAWRAYTQRPR